VFGLFIHLYGYFKEIVQVFIFTEIHFQLFLIKLLYFHFPFPVFHIFDIQNAVPIHHFSNLYFFIYFGVTNINEV
jgi:hypothetical protein